MIKCNCIVFSCYVGNGTAELTKHDPGIFFASVHMLYHDASFPEPSKPTTSQNISPEDADKKFYPEPLGKTEILDTYISIAIKPSLSFGNNSNAKRVNPKRTFGDMNDGIIDVDDGENNSILSDAGIPVNETISAMDIDDSCTHDGSIHCNEENGVNVDNSESKIHLNSNGDIDMIHIESVSSNSNNLKFSPGAKGYRQGIIEIIKRMTVFEPELLIISAGFDGYRSDPVGGDLKLSLEDYKWSTREVASIRFSLN